MARVHHKAECETEHQLHCGQRFDCSFDNSKSTEPEASVTFWRGATLAVTNDAKTPRLKVFNTEQRTLTHTANIGAKWLSREQQTLFRISEVSTRGSLAN